MLQPPFKAKAVVSWPGEEPGDLGFLEDEVIEVTGFVDDSWWNGYLLRNRAEGIFPKDYVEAVDAHAGSADMLQHGESDNIKSLTAKMSDSRIDANRPHLSHLKNKKAYAKSTPNINKSLHEKGLLKTQSSSQLKNVSLQSKTNVASPPSHRRIQDSFDTSNLSYHEDSLFADQSRDSIRSGKAKRSSRSPENNAMTSQDIAIARKKAQLELELLRLYEIEKKICLQTKGTSPACLLDSQDPTASDESVPHSSRGEELGRNLERDRSFTIDDNNDLENEEEEEDDDDDEPPPPPPKRTFNGRTNNNTRGPAPTEKKSPLQNLTSKPPVRVPFDAADFRTSGGSLSEQDILRLSQMQPEELRASILLLKSDVLNLSELSATSAGSFIRHKYDAALKNSMAQLNMHEASDDPQAAAASGSSTNRRSVIDQVFDEKKSRHSIFKKILNKRGGDDTNLLERKVQSVQPDDWALLKASVHRMNSLCTLDKQARTRRVLRQEGNLIVRPWDYVTSVNANETLDEEDLQIHENPLALSNSTLRRIDAFMAKYPPTCDLNDVIADVSAKFHASPPCQIRCILVHLCKFEVIEEVGKILMVKPRLAAVTEKGQVTIFQLNYLFKKILDAFRIPSEVVVGFWKKPNEFYHNEEYVVNHCWLSILVENRFFISDIFCFKNGSMFNIRDHPRGFNEFYAGTEPLLIVSTHIPSVIDLQHVIPPIDHNVAFFLPRAYLGFYRNSLQFVNHNNALSRLKDMEIFELELEVPVSVELFTLVKTCQATTNELSLCQVKWVKNRRIAKIKAILPHQDNIGVLQVFAGPKGTQKHFDNVHELAVVIPLYHEGEGKPGKFVLRFPTVQSQNHDLYIQQPQLCLLVRQNAYNFEVLQYPSMGLGPLVDGMPAVKLVVESPLGKYYKLVSDDPLKPYGTFLCNIRCQEVGAYRGLVIGDSGTSWYVFAQWECAASV